MKKYILVLLTIVIVFSFTGCNKNEDVITDNNQEIEENDTPLSEGQNENNVPVIEEQNENSIKNLLVAGGEWIPQNAYDVLEQKEVELSFVYGSGIKYGGGITFFDDGRFEKFIGVGGENQDMFNLGTYSIDIANNQIIYKFNAGNISNGKYVYENGEIESITFEEIFGDEDAIVSKYIVTLVKKSPERLSNEKLINSLTESIWLPVSATQNGKQIALKDVYGKNYKSDLGIKFYGGEDMDKDLNVEDYSWSPYGFYYFNGDKIMCQFITDSTTSARVDVPCEYELQDGKVVSLTFIENYGTDNEINVKFKKQNDKKLLTTVYGEKTIIDLTIDNKKENVENFLIDIDMDGVNELIKPTFEYMENHLHIFKIIDGKVEELDNNKYVGLITSIYETSDGVYVVGVDADGMCYTDISLCKINIVDNKVVLDKILNATCDQEAEEVKRKELSEKLNVGDITQDEFDKEYESAFFHTLKYSINENVVSKDKFDAKIKELNNIKLIRRIAYIYDTFEDLWTNN